VKFIIIGNGIAGNTAGSTIRRLNTQADITIISEEVYPQYSACALPPYLAGELRRHRLFLRTRKDYSREGIKLVRGQKVNRISAKDKTIFLDDRSLVYDKLIIATGSRPIIPPIEGVDLEGVFPLKTLSDADRIRHTVARVAAVVGSGPIGTEAAIALSKRGIKVYLVELLNRIAPRVFDDGPASLLRDILEQHGVTVLTGESITRITGNNGVEYIVTSKRRIECDMVILAAGMKPNTKLAQQAGVSIGTLGGISVTNRMMTNVNDVYACGDCVEAEDMVTGNHTLSLLWHNARNQGEVAGHNCCGVSKFYPGSINITSVDVFGTHAVSIGSTEAKVGQHEDIEVIERLSTKNYHRLILSQGRLIGAQFIGDTRDMGPLLYALIRKDKLRNPAAGSPLLPLILRDWHLLKLPP
jgi:NADH oxidase (H2O2-forming)